MATQKTDGYAIDEREDHWIVECPECEKEYDCSGYFDPGEKTKCSCGCVFITEKVWLNDTTYIL